MTRNRMPLKILINIDYNLQPELYGLKDLSVQLEQLDGPALTFSTGHPIMLLLNGDTADSCEPCIREIPGSSCAYALIF